MGSEPLLLKVDSWELEVSVNDDGTKIIMHDRSKTPGTSHFMRLDPTQSQALKQYLWHELPSSF